jgi:hypothetical protein
MEGAKKLLMFAEKAHLVLMSCPIGEGVAVSLLHHHRGVVIFLQHNNNNQQINSECALSD